MIELINFSIKNSFGKYLFKDINLTIKRGEVLGITGRSGSGKTLLALSIAGVKYGGLHSEGKVLRRNIQNTGILFQNPLNQIFSSRVYEQLKTSLFLNSMNTDDKYIELIASEWDIDDILYKETSKLSLGEAQKVAIASIMISKPDLIILDEPFQYVDNYSFEKNTEKLKNAENKPAIIIIEHNYYMLNKISDKILKLEDNHGVVQKTLEVPEGKDVIIEALSEKKYFEFNSVFFSYFRFKKNFVFKDFSFLFRNGFLIIDGKNGSGKSTFVKLLARVLKQKKGSVKINFGKREFINPKLEDIRGNIGYIFQNPDYQIFSDTVKDEILFGVKDYNEDYFNYWVKKFDIEFLLDRSPLLLSYGERRRVNFLSATIRCPNLIIYDEPTVGLDYENRLLLLEFIEYHNKRGALQVLISHDRWFKKKIKGDIKRLKL